MKKKLAFTALGIAFAAALVSTAVAWTGAESPVAASGVATAADGLAKLKSLGFTVFPNPKEAKDYDLKKLDGTTVKLSSMKGKVVMLNFWATWCPPCREEMPSIEKLYLKTRELPFEIVAVSSGESDTVVRKFVNDRKFTFPIYLDTNGTLGGRWSVSAIPTTYVIDTKGMVVARVVGGLDYDKADFEAAIKALSGK